MKKYSELWELVESDSTNHKLKEIAELFLEAMTDWPTYNQEIISEFITELKDFFGSPLTPESFRVASSKLLKVFLLVGIRVLSKSTKTTMLNKIHHTAIICSDYQKSKKFYTEVLGLAIIREVYPPLPPESFRVAGSKR